MKDSVHVVRRRSFSRQLCVHAIQVCNTSLNFINENKLSEKSRAFSDTSSESYRISLAMWDHNVIYHPTQMNTPFLNCSQRPVLALDLPTLEGWKAELT